MHRLGGGQLAQPPHQPLGQIVADAPEIPLTGAPEEETRRAVAARLVLEADPAGRIVREERIDLEFEKLEVRKGRRSHSPPAAGRSIAGEYSTRKLDFVHSDVWAHALQCAHISFNAVVW